MFVQHTYHDLDSLDDLLFYSMFHNCDINYIITYMIMKSANLMALSALLAPEESLMEKEAMMAGRAARSFAPKAKHVRKK